MDLSQNDMKVYAKKNKCHQWLDLDAAKLVPSIDTVHGKGQTLQYFMVLKQKPLNQQTAGVPTVGTALLGPELPST
eukprot:8849842-Heterocapsa_arctica.AAC.1